MVKLQARQDRSFQLLAQSRYSASTTIKTKLLPQLPVALPTALLQLHFLPPAPLPALSTPVAWVPLWEFPQVAARQAMLELVGECE